MALGHRIKAARELAKLDQSELARRAGVPQATLSAIELRDSNRSNYSEALIRALPADVVNLQWVRTGEGSMEGPTHGAPTHWMDRHTQLGERAGVPCLGSAAVEADGKFSLQEDHRRGTGTVEIDVDHGGAVAYRVTGSALFPVLRDGWYFVTIPGRAVAQGEFIVMKLKTGPLVLRELLYKREHTLEVVGVKDQQRETIDSDQVEFTNPVVAIAPPSMWRP